MAIIIRRGISPVTVATAFGTPNVVPAGTGSCQSVVIRGLASNQGKPPSDGRRWPNPTHGAVRHRHAGQPFWRDATGHCRVRRDGSGCLDRAGRKAIRLKGSRPDRACRRRPGKSISLRLAKFGRGSGRDVMRDGLAPHRILSDAHATLVTDDVQNQRKSQGKLTNHGADLDKRVGPAARCADVVAATDPDGPLHLAPSCTCIA